MLVSKTSEVSIAAFDWFLAFGSDEDLFRQLLHVKEENMRARAVFYLQSRVQSTNTLAQILEQCQDSGYYYYDVVTWLDRFLYAPLPFRELFLSDLKKQLH
jgi:hypothetical protein